MRIKYLGTKLILILATLFATPVVWAALAWPEWEAAGSAPDEAAVPVATVSAAPDVQPGVLIQPVIQRVIVVPRYIEVQATLGPGQVAAAPPAAPAGTSLPLPTQAPVVVTPPVAVAGQRQDPPPPQQQQQTSSSGGSGGGGDAPADPPPATDPGSSGGGNTSSHTTTKGS
jgi:hypothetical protein